LRALKFESPVSKGSHARAGIRLLPRTSRKKKLNALFFRNEDAPEKKKSENTVKKIIEASVSMRGKATKYHSKNSKETQRKTWTFTKDGVPNSQRGQIIFDVNGNTPIPTCRLPEPPF